MFLLTRVAATSLALLLLSATALAQGVVDQQNDPTATSGFGCGSPPILNGTVLQSFVPQADNLVAVELRLLAGSAFPVGGTTSVARIRAGTSTGTVLGEATATVAGPLSQGTQVLVRHDFTQIALTPGNTYLIEWVTPATTVLTWVGATGDLYPSGTAYSCSGNIWPVTGTDLNFVTYRAAPPPPEPEPEPAPEPAPEPEPTQASCESLLADLRTAVDALELKKWKRCVMNRLLSGAERELGRGKPKAASALVMALELQVRTLARLGVISSEEATEILDIAEEFRVCLGVGPKAHHAWHWDYHHSH